MCHSGVSFGALAKYRSPTWCMKGRLTQEPPGNRPLSLGTLGHINTQLARLHQGLDSDASQMPPKCLSGAAACSPFTAPLAPVTRWQTAASPDTPHMPLRRPFRCPSDAPSDASQVPLSCFPGTSPMPLSCRSLCSMCCTSCAKECVADRCKSSLTSLGSRPSPSTTVRCCRPGSTCCSHCPCFRTCCCACPCCCPCCPPCLCCPCCCCLALVV